MSRIVNDQRATTALVERYIGTAYDTVKRVADNLSTLLGLQDDVDEVLGRWLGEQASNPTQRTNGDPLQSGDQYYNTTVDSFRIYIDDEWQDWKNLVRRLPPETKNLTAGQLEVTFVNNVNYGSLFVSGSNVDRGRLLKDVDYTLSTDGLTVTLTESYPANSKLTFVGAEYDVVGASDYDVAQDARLDALEADSNAGCSLQVRNGTGGGVLVTAASMHVRHIVHVTGAGARSIQIPTSIITDGTKVYEITVKDSVGNASGGNIVITGEGSEDIDNGADYTLDTDYQSVTFYTYNSKLWIK
jgi:hypothetical protein